MCATVGSSTLIGWKRRSSAASFSRCLRYSSRVVADRLELAAREHRLEDARGVDRALGGPGADERVQLVDEQHDVAARADLLQDLLQALLEVAAVARAGDERAEVERVDLLALEGLRDLAADDVLREALDDRGLADAGLADQHRVVLRPARQHLHDPLDLLLAADHRVELGVTRELGEVPAELVEHHRALTGLLALSARRRLALAGGVAGQELDHGLADAVEVRRASAGPARRRPRPRGSARAGCARSRCSCDRAAAPRGARARGPSWRAA